MAHGPYAMVHKPQSMGPLGPFLPKSNEAKRGQVGPKPQVGPTKPVLAPKLNQGFPLKFRGRPFLPRCTLHIRIQEWCIYGIIDHYAPFLLRNPIVTPSGPNYVIPNQVPNPSTILKEDLSAIQSGNFLAATRRPFKDPTTWPCNSWVINPHQNYSKRNFQRLSIILIIFKASSTHHSLDISIGP
ncbi:hypothetical protein O181_039716 [Austropuccinia psidii MF-1]|uniref:Uncharacterized protein n=1 Tax=Austropuccinia psidii MF-1 TaxID=1389203 RepID=A0A9Q3DGF4_9BASI|nr:hypothetical protein [Austropuccinia psidii MF-1]